MESQCLKLNDTIDFIDIKTRHLEIKQNVEYIGFLDRLNLQGIYLYL